MEVVFIPSSTSYTIDRRYVLAFKKWLANHAENDICVKTPPLLWRCVLVKREFVDSISSCYRFAMLLRFDLISHLLRNSVIDVASLISDLLIPVSVMNHSRGLANAWFMRQFLNSVMETGGCYDKQLRCCRINRNSSWFTPRCGWFTSLCCWTSLFLPLMVCGTAVDVIPIP